MSIKYFVCVDFEATCGPEVSRHSQAEIIGELKLMWNFLVRIQNKVQFNLHFDIQNFRQFCWTQRPVELNRNSIVSFVRRIDRYSMVSVANWLALLSSKSTERIHFQKFFAHSCGGFMQKSLKEICCSTRKQIVIEPSVKTSHFARGAIMIWNISSNWKCDDMKSSVRRVCTFGLISNRNIRYQLTVGLGFHLSHLLIECVSFVIQKKYGCRCALKRALHFLNIRQEGRAHSGISDARNLAKVIMHLKPKPGNAYNWEQF